MEEKEVAREGELQGVNWVADLCYNRRNGMVPALGIGGPNQAYRELNALGFEPVYPEGCPAAFKANKDFTPFVLTDNDEIDVKDWTLGEVDKEAIPRTIVKFVDIFATVYEAITEEFKDEPPKEDLDPGYHPVYSIAFDNRNVSLPSLERRITRERLAEMHPIPPEFSFADYDVLRVMLSGFARQHPWKIFTSSLQKIMWEFDVTIRCCSAPAETSVKPLDDGVPHCLVYGYDDDNPQPNSDKDDNSPPNRAANRVGRIKERARRGPREICRKILTKLTSDRSKSRSRSRSPQERIGTNFAMNVMAKDPHQQRRRVHLRDLLHFPFKYCLQPEFLVDYLESHKPDILFLEQLENDDCEVKLVVQITSMDRYSSDVFDTILKNATSDCLWSALASLQHGQHKVFGLVALCEGMKAIKVELVNNRWNVFETELICYADRAALRSMLYHVCNQSSQKLRGFHG